MKLNDNSVKTILITAMLVLALMPLANAVVYYSDLVKGDDNNYLITNLQEIDFNYTDTSILPPIWFTIPVYDVFNNHMGDILFRGTLLTKQLDVNLYDGQGYFWGEMEFIKDASFGDIKTTNTGELFDISNPYYGYCEMNDYNVICHFSNKEGWNADAYSALFIFSSDLKMLTALELNKTSAMVGIGKAFDSLLVGFGEVSGTGTAILGNDFSVGYSEDATLINSNNNGIFSLGCKSTDSVSGYCMVVLKDYIDYDSDGFNSDIDCNDNNNLINPLALEIVYNGIDDDCSDLTLDDDLDQDGFNLADDCNDNDLLININALEINDNQIDENCDGTLGVTQTSTGSSGGGGGSSHSHPPVVKNVTIITPAEPIKETQEIAEEPKEEAPITTGAVTAETTNGNYIIAGIVVLLALIIGFFIWKKYY